MKVKDESEWQLFCAEIAKDPDPRAEPFRDFLVAWAERAEEMLSTAETASEFIASARHAPSDAVEALRATLRAVEADLGRWTVGYLGMALVVFGTHWAPADAVEDFFNSMTPIEQNLFADVAEVKLVELAKAAEDDPFNSGELFQP